MTDQLTARRLYILIEQYVEARSPRCDHVSIMRARKAIGQQMPELDIPARDFETLVARQAVGRGLAVYFDGKRRVD